MFSPQQQPGLGRVTSIGVAPIEDVDSTTGSVKVALTASGAKSPSNWIWRLSQANGLTMPSYQPGDTLVYGVLEDNLNTAFQIGIVQNAVNPPAQTDRLTYVLGDSAVVITDDSISLGVGNASIVITDGKITLSVGGTSINLASGSAYINSNSSQLATLGAKDSHNDTVNVKGW